MAFKTKTPVTDEVVTVGRYADGAYDPCDWADHGMFEDSDGTMFDVEFGSCAVTSSSDRVSFKCPCMGECEYGQLKSDPSNTDKPRSYFCPEMIQAYVPTDSQGTASGPCFRLDREFGGGSNQNIKCLYKANSDSIGNPDNQKDCIF